MFGFVDNRTPEERKRDQEAGDRMRADQQLSIGFMQNVVRKTLKGVDGLDVGVVGKECSMYSTLLIEHGGVTYELTARVNHDN